MWCCVVSDRDISRVYIESCGDTCQMWTWYLIADHCLDNGKNWSNNKWEEIGFVTPPLVRYQQIISHIFQNRVISQWSNLDESTGDPIYYYGLILILAWRSNHMSSKVWDEITYPFHNFDGCTVELWEWMRNFIPHIIMDVITYPCWD